MIYRTNAATSYAAGRTAQLVDENFKYWVYRHGASLEPRDQHLAWDGLILPPSHPFWLKHAPPNGWGCSCYIVGARSIAGAKRVGGKPGLTLPSDWDAIDAQTGVPRGIDRGWDYSPGASVVSTIQSLRAKLDTLPDQPSIALIQDWLLHDVFANWLKSPVGSWPIARLTKADAAAIGSQKLVADLSADTVAKQMRRHPEITATDYVQAQRVVTSPTHTVQDTPNSIIFVRAVEGEDGFVLVVKATRSGEGLFLTSLRRLSSDEAQRDRTIGQLLRKS